jgi:hypothetical protein
MNLTQPRVDYLTQALVREQAQERHGVEESRMHEGSTESSTEAPTKAEASIKAITRTAQEE